MSLLLAFCLASVSVTAQWSADPAANLSIGDGAGEQAQPKVVPDAGQGSWVSWFSGSGYDVRVQLLDGGGNEQFAHNGVLVSDRGFSSTQDYSLALATDGAALLAFRDDNFTGTQISAAKVTTAGTLAWGASNVQLTATASFVAAPVIAAAPGGGAYVAWTQDNTVRVQRLDASGTAVWGSDTVFTPTSGNFSVNDAQPSGTGVILSFIADNGFASPRHLYAQRLDSAGAPTWASGHVKVFDGGSLQFGNFPDFEVDGSGGAVFSWYDTAGASLQCYVQHVLANGTEQFAHNGVAVSTNAAQQRVSPEASYDAGNAEITVAWVELNSNQSQSGVSVNRIDASGARLWGASGKVLSALGAGNHSNVRAQVSGTNSFAVWTRDGGGGDVIEGARLDSAGTIDVTTFDISSTLASKFRLRETLTGAGDMVLVWNDDGAGTTDVLGQNVQPDGSLGADQTWTDLGGAIPGSAGVPALAGTGTLVASTGMSLDLTNAPSGATVLLWLSVASTPLPYFGGTVYPFPPTTGFLLSANGSGALSIGGTWPAGVPGGTNIWFQYLIDDPSLVWGISLTNGLLATTP